MTKLLNVVENMERVGRRLQQHYGEQPIPVAEIVHQVADECGCTKASVILSDHCYNRTNNGIKLQNDPMFVHVGDERSGLYQFVGRNYPYTGPQFHHPKDGPPRKVGNWVNGQLQSLGEQAAYGSSGEREANAGS